MKSKGYSLWLVPTGQTYQEFSNLIKQLAKKYNTPVFQPHVTLLGEFMQPEDKCIKLTKQLVADQIPFTVQLGEIYYEDFFFRTLFVRVNKTKPLLALHERAKEIFKMNIPPYMPHLSILYGTFPVYLKERIIKEIGRDQSDRWEVNKVTLVKGGEVEDWQIAGEYPFKF